MLTKKQPKEASSLKKRWIETYAFKWHPYNRAQAERYFDIIRAVDSMVKRGAKARVDGDNITIEYTNGKVRINVNDYPQVVTDEIVDMIIQAIET